MPQLIILMGVLSIANFVVFNAGVDYYEENILEPEEGVVEVYEVDEKEKLMNEEDLDLEDENL